MGYFDELAKTIKADEEVLKKYPALVEALSQAESTMAELQELRRKHEAAENALRRWNEWAAQHWDPTQNMTKLEASLIKRVDELERQLSQQQQAGENTMTTDFSFDADQSEFSRLAEMLRQSGYMTRQDLDTYLANRPTKQDLESAIQNAVQRMASFYTEVDSVGWDHYRKFGEPLDKNALFKYMADNQIASVRDAYEKMIQPRLEELRQKEVQQKIEQARREAAEQARREAAMAAAKLPTDYTGSAMAAVGPFQRRLMEKAKGNVPEAPLGKGIVAQMIAEKIMMSGGSGGAEGE